MNSPQYIPITQAFLSMTDLFPHPENYQVMRAFNQRRLFEAYNKAFLESLGFFSFEAPREERPVNMRGGLSGRADVRTDWL